jgi:hypothetical protein
VVEQDGKRHDFRDTGCDSGGLTMPDPHTIVNTGKHEAVLFLVVIYR